MIFFDNTKRKNIKNAAIFLCLFVFVTMAGASLWKEEMSPQFSLASLTSTQAQTDTEGKKPVGPILGARAAISVEVGETPEHFLFDKNAEEKLPIASITKLMTALIVMENYDLGQKLQITQGDVAWQLQKQTLKAGEYFSVADILFDALVESNNGAAYALSRVAGEKEFVALMNKKAAELGLQNTGFKNPSGLDFDGGNYSTARDLAKLAANIIKSHPLIFEITARPDFSLCDFNEKNCRTIVSTNQLLTESIAWKDRIVGGKTGETKQAGKCLLLVLRNEKNNGYLINVVLHSNDNFKDMKSLVGWQEAPVESLSDAKLLDWKEVASAATFGPRDSHGVVVFRNKMWVMGGLNGNGHVTEPGVVSYGDTPYFSDIWSSKDGKNWKLETSAAPWGERRSMQVVEFNGKLWLFGGWGPKLGYQNDVWSSVDGINWKEEINVAPFPAREGHSALVFDNKLWLIGGVRYDTNTLFNDTWHSEDGVHWIEATPDAGWTPRWDHAVAVFHSKLWLMGGMTFGGRFFNDIWQSDDGAHWTRETSYAPFWPRQGNFITDHKGKLWVIGRLNGELNGGPNDVWFSDNGTDWQKTQKNPSWTGREDFGGLIFNDRLWIIGGMDETWHWKGDVWESTF